MIKVDSKEMIHGLAKRFLKINRNRNIIVIIAIIITSVLFTSLFTATFSMIKSAMESDMRMTMDKSHAVAEDLTQEQYEKLSKDSNIKKLGLSIFLTLAENDELETLQTEIRYADKNAADSYQCLPTVGRLPVKENEIATSTIVLDALGIDHKIGETIHLTYTLKNEKINKDFNLCGYWEGDPIAMGQMAWISKVYCKNAAAYATKEKIEKGIYEGDYNAYIWYTNIFNLNQKVENLEKRYSLEDNNAKLAINPAFDIFDSDAFPYGTVSIILVIIMLSGYLFIYNVFNISVNTDIRSYGLLKNVGTTGKQLKKIVRLQALWLSIIGIPCGIILGFLLGKTMTPFLIADLTEQTKSVVQASISVHPTIFIVSALFSLATVYAGCLKPCQIVEKLSPIEAVLMTDYKSHKKSKRKGSVSTLYMAISNIGRNWYKSGAVILSLALSLMLLNMVYMIVNGFDFDSYTSMKICSDIELRGEKNDGDEGNKHIITPEIRKSIEKSQDVASVGYIFFTPAKHRVDDLLYQNLKNYLKYMGEASFSKWILEDLNSIIDKRKIESHIIGINEAAFNKMNFYKEGCTWDEFASGKYIITNSLDCGEYNSYYYARDKVKVKFNDTKSKEYTVLSVADLPISISYITDLFPLTFYLPEKEYVKETGDNNARVAIIEAKKGKLKSVSEWVNDYNKINNNCFKIKSRYELKKQFSNFINKYYMIGVMLTTVLFIIAILNFFNTSATSIISRKKELTLLEVVGMTKKQIRTMLSLESIINLLLALLLTLTVGTIIAKRLINMTVGELYYYHCRTSVLPSILVLPILIFIVLTVPIYNYRRMCSETIVERIRKDI